MIEVSGCGEKTRLLEVWKFGRFFLPLLIPICLDNNGVDGVDREVEEIDYIIRAPHSS